MAKSSQLVSLTPEQLREIPEFRTVKNVDIKFPKRAVAAADAKAAQAKWLNSVKAPKVEQPAAKRIKAVMLSSAHVDKLRAVHESTAPTAELIGQKMDPDALLGIAYSAFVIFHYTKLAADRKKKLAAAKGKPVADDEWKQVVDGAIAAFAAAGQKDVSEANLDEMAAELGRSKANFNAVATIANTATAVAAPAAQPLGLGNFVTQTGVLPLAGINIVFPPNLCSQPLAQGTYTKHLGHTFSLQVSFNAPCIPKFWKTCHYTLTIASLSYSVDLNVGYKVTCCGASAWGQAAAQVCGSILGHTACASCSASITALAGVSKNVQGSNCIYGLGVVAELKCQAAGITVLDFVAPFGWTITAPCPPPGFPC